MSIKGGPKIETDGLVLYYDVDNIDSYPGEPTTNIATSQTMFSHNGHGVMTFSDAPERGTDWKKVNITHRGNDFRITQMPYNTQPDGTTHAFSIEIDWGTTSGYYVQGDGSTGFSITGNTSDWPHGTYTNSSGGNRVEALFLYNQTYDVDVDDTIYYRYYQVEVKSHSTPYTSGTRSTTNGLKDLSGQGNHGDLANATYDSNALLDLDGSAGYFVPSSTINLPANANWTVGMWVKTGESCYLLSNLSGGPVANSLRISGGKINYYHYNSGWLSESGTSTVNDNVWHYLVWVNHIGSTIDLYVDGIGENMGDDSAGPITGPLDVFGKNWSTDYMDGKINVIQYWNSTDLTSTQVLNNYNAMKSRFGH